MHSQEAGRRPQGLHESNSRVGGTLVVPVAAGTPPRSQAARARSSGPGPTSTASRSAPLAAETLSRSGRKRQRFFSEPSIPTNSGPAGVYPPEWAMRSPETPAIGAALKRLRDGRRLSGVRNGFLNRYLRGRLSGLGAVSVVAAVSLCLGNRTCQNSHTRRPRR